MKNANSKQAKGSGWVLDVGEHDDWQCVVKAHNDDLGIVRSTKRLAVPGGWIYRVTTERREKGRVIGCSEALAFVPVAEDAEDYGVVSSPDDEEDLG